MKKTLLALALGTLFLDASAQELTGADLKEIASSFVKDGPTTALQNALTAEANLRKLALNRDLQGKIDHYFKYRVEVKGITDQKQSGRCWMFTSMNVLRPSVMERFGLSEFDFSHNYNYFWDMFEKSNLFLENAVATADRPMTDRDVEFFFKTPVGDGGVWNLFYNVAEKYGVVPREVMPETAHSNNTAYLRSVLNERLRAGGYELRGLAASGADRAKIAAAKIAVLKDVSRVLALCLGEPPARFEWRYETRDGEVKTLRTTPLDEPANAFIKRTFDIVVSGLLLVLLSPLFLILAIAIRLSSPGPVLFRQERIGLNKKPFTMYKFRSMRVNDEQDTAWSSAEDDRRTWLGAFLRKVSIDELPQLWNVLTGTMSLVGTRPGLPLYVERFRAPVPLYLVKYQVRPGITA